MALSFCCTAVTAQALFRCTVDGRPVLSDKPCLGRPSTTINAVGPLREPATTTYTVPVAKASPLLSYQSPLCAELNEGMRNGPARGLGPRAMSELREGYREKCSEDEAHARQRMSEDQRQHLDARVAEDRADKAERDRLKLSREQCDEMYRIVAGRRKRLADMGPGERADFDRFEANWKGRCLTT